MDSQRCVSGPRPFLEWLFVVLGFLSGCTESDSITTGASGQAQQRRSHVVLKAGTVVYALDARAGQFKQPIRLHQDTCVTQTAVYGTGNQGTLLLNFSDELNHVWALAPAVMVKPGSNGCRAPFTIPNYRRIMTCPVNQLSDDDRLASTQRSSGTWEVLHRLDGYAWAQGNGQRGLISDHCVEPRWPGNSEYTLRDYITLMNQRFLRLNTQVKQTWYNVIPTRPDDLDPSASLVQEYIGVNVYAQDCLTCFLKPFHRDPEVVRAALLNVLSTRHYYRKNGLAYAIHPAALSYYIMELAESQLVPDDLRQILVLAHTHDVIEELINQFYVLDRRYDNPWLSLLREDEPVIEGIRQLKIKLNAMFPKEWRIGDKVVLLMESELRHSISPRERYEELAAEWQTTPFVVEHALFAHMLRGADDFHVATVKVADRIDFFMNYDFILQRSEYDRKRARDQFIGNIARGYWALQYYLNATVDEFHNGLPHRATAHVPGFPQALLDLAYAIIEHALYDDPRIDKLLEENDYVPVMTREKMIGQVRLLIAEFERVARDKKPELDRITWEYLEDLEIPEAERF